MNWPRWDAWIAGYSYRIPVVPLAVICKTQHLGIELLPRYSYTVHLFEVISIHFFNPLFTVVKSIYEVRYLRFKERALNMAGNDPEILSIQLADLEKQICGVVVPWSPYRIVSVTCDIAPMHGHPKFPRPQWSSVAPKFNCFPTRYWPKLNKDFKSILT